MALFFSRFEPIVADWLSVMLRLFLACIVIVFLVHGLVAAIFPYPLDYGEAPLLDQAMRLTTGKNIYRADITQAPYTIANYPPLYALALAPFVELFGPSFFFGRVISLICALAAATCLALTIYSLSGDRLAASVTGMLFVATPYVVQWSALVRIDMLALAFSTAALLVVARWPAEKRSTVVAALLLAAAVFTRQSYALAAPLAAFVWLWTHSRRRALELALVSSSTVLLLFFVLVVSTRGGFFYNIVSANVNEFGVERLADGLNDLWSTAPVILLMAGAFLFVAPATGMPAWSLLVPYTAGAFLSALTVGKIGSNVNYFLELVAACSLVGGAYLWWIRGHPWLRNFLLLVLLLQSGALVKTALEKSVSRTVSRVRDRSVLEELESIVAKADGPVLADEFMGMMTLHWQALYMQPFEVTQLARAGLWDQTGLLRSIENSEFPLILVYQFPRAWVHEERWTTEMLAAIDENYKPSQNLAGNIVYRPKSEVDAVTALGPVQIAEYFPSNIKVGKLQRVTQAPYVFDPTIAVNPNHPDHLAVTVAVASDEMCDLPDCQVDLVLHTSTDGGATWTEQHPFPPGLEGIWDGMSRFAYDNTLFALGLHDRMVVNRSQAVNLSADYQMSPTDAVTVPSSQVFIKPSLHINPVNDELLLIFTGRHQENLGIALKRSTSRGEEWTYGFVIDKGVPLVDVQRGQATPPLGAQLMLGEQRNLAAVWEWSPGLWRLPMGVWFGASLDGGATFSPARQIAETWSLSSVANHDGAYHVLYRTGNAHEQQIVLSSSHDGGSTWEAIVVNGDLAVSSDLTKAPGVSVAPGGTIDIVFYAHSQDEPMCELDYAKWGRALAEDVWTDTCVYGVYYTYSNDGGQSFSKPVRLNQQPIKGVRFVHFNGSSLASFRMSVASTENAAYPIWVETQGDEGTQAYTVRIER